MQPQKLVCYYQGLWNAKIKLSMLLYWLDFGIDPSELKLKKKQLLMTEENQRNHRKIN